MAVVGAIAVAVGSAQTSAAQEAVPYESVPVVGAGVDGPVWASELIGDELWIGGEFTTARDYVPGAQPMATSGIAVIDINTGELVRRSYSFDGPVYGIEFVDDTIWIVGNFDNVNGSPAQNVVALDAIGGGRKSGFVGASNRQLRDVVYHDGWLYLGGNPSFYNGSSVTRVLRVNPETGALDTSWRPDIDLFVESLDASGGLVLAAERAEDRAAEVKLLSVATAEKVAGLDPVSNELRGTGMWDAEFASDGQSVYTAETGNSVGKYSLDDRVRWASQRSDGDMQAVAANDDFVFAGFHEGWADNRNRHIVAFRADTGRLEPSWIVETNDFWGVRDIEMYEQGLVVAGEFTSVNGVSARRIAIFRPTAAWPLAQALDRPLAGDVNCDNVADVADALFLAQFEVGNRIDVDGCDAFEPVSDIYAAGGDVDGDGSAGIIDAMLIAQCSVGNPNIFCPAN